MSLFMGIDQSFTSTGTIFLDSDLTIIDVKIITSSKTDDFFERAWKISQEINDLIIKNKPTSIALEGLAFGGTGNATRQLSGLQYTIINNIRKNINISLDCTIIPPTTLKKFATNKGNSSKIEMYNALPEIVKTKFLECGLKKTKGLYDCVDAYFLAKYIKDHC